MINNDNNKHITEKFFVVVQVLEMFFIVHSVILLLQQNQNGWCRNDFAILLEGHVVQNSSAILAIDYSIICTYSVSDSMKNNDDGVVQ